MGFWVAFHQERVKVKDSLPVTPLPTPPPAIMWVEFKAAPEPNPMGFGKDPTSALSKSVHMSVSLSYTSTDVMGWNMGSKLNPPAATTNSFPDGVVMAATIGQHLAAFNDGVSVDQAATALLLVLPTCTADRSKKETLK
jgi:hypothetical protein